MVFPRYGWLGHGSVGPVAFQEWGRPGAAKGEVEEGICGTWEKKVTRFIVLSSLLRCFLLFSKLGLGVLLWKSRMVFRRYYSLVSCLTEVDSF